MNWVHMKFFKNLSFLFIWILPVSLIFSFTFLSCDLFFQSGVTFDEDTFNKEYQLWENNEPSNYSFLFYSKDFSSGATKVKVSVSNGIGTYEGLDRFSLNYDKIKSMEDVFEEIKNTKNELELESSENKDIRYEFSMTFDKEFHYPVKVIINLYSKKMGLMGTSSSIIEITDFIVLDSQ